MAGRAWIAFGCVLAWSLSGTACAPSEDKDAGDTPRRPLLQSDARPASAVPAGLVRFDLVCHTTRQFDLLETHYPGARPYRPPNRRDDTLRRIIDLERMVYCYSSSCGGSKRDAIAAVTPEGIVFEDHPDLVNFYRWDSGLSEGRYTYEGRTSIQQGQCRIEPFSGFPPPGPRRVFLREKPGTGPHPFEHEGLLPGDEIVGGSGADEIGRDNSGAVPGNGA